MVSLAVHALHAACFILMRASGRCRIMTTRVLGCGEFPEACATMMLWWTGADGGWRALCSRRKGRNKGRAGTGGHEGRMRLKGWWAKNRRRVGGGGEGRGGEGRGVGHYLQAWSMRSLSSLMVSSLRLRLPCRDLARDSAACTSIEWSAALAARTASSKSST